MADFIAQHHHVNQDGYLTMVERLYMGFGWGPLPRPEGANIVGELPARVNHGRWLIDCPHCRAAQVAEFENPVFMCVECANGGNNGHWYAVAIPGNYQEIETVLLARPMGVNPADSPTRNWEPGETVETLLAENQHNGIEV